MKRYLGAVAAVAAFCCPTIASAAQVIELEPNDTIATAQNIDAFFSMEADPDIENSTTRPHVTVVGLPGDGTYDVFSFTAASNSFATFDIDYAYDINTRIGFDSYLTLYDGAGQQLRTNDDNCGTFGDCTSALPGAGGSNYGLDSYFSYSFSDAGTYFIEVGNCCKGPQAGGSGYELQVSLQDHAVTSGAVPEPATWAMMVIGFGAVGMGMRSSRRKTALAAA